MEEAFNCSNLLYGHEFIRFSVSPKMDVIIAS